MIGGKGSDKVGPTKIIIGSVIGVLLSLFFLLLVPTSYLVVVAFTFIYGVAVFAHQPSMTNLVSRVTPRHLMGLSYGVMFFFSFGLGSVAAAILGWLTDVYGIVYAFWANAVVAVALLAVTLLIYRTFNKFNHA